MNPVPLAAALLSYTVASGLYLGHLFTNRSTLVRFARLGLILGLFFHTAWIGLRYQQLGLSPLSDVHEAMSAFSWLLVASFLSLRLLQSRLDAAGLFLAPIAQILLAVGAVTAPQQQVPHRLGLTLLPIHIGAAIAGTVALALASAAALMYLLLERHLKQKRFGAIYQRFPSLDILDNLSYRCAAVGFPVFTVAIVIGVFTAREALTLALLGTGSQLLQYTIGVLGWALFGLMLQTRLMVGWRGRRPALLTIAGFLCALTVLFLYLTR